MANLPVPTDIADSIKVREEIEGQVFQTIEAFYDFLRVAILKYDRIDYLMEHVLGYDVEKCHADMLKFQSMYEKCLVLAPRGIGKSTCLTVVRAIFELIQNPNLRILIVSNTQLQAETFLREIKQHFAGNEKLIAIFGNYEGSKWDSKEINIKPRTSFAKESNITCCGVGGAIVGRHYDLILADDLIDEDNGRTELQRERFRVWYYKSLDPTLEPDGRFYVHGTRYYPADHYGHLIHNDEDYKHMVFPAIKPDGKSLWESKMSLKWLEGKKKSQGTAIFNTQYMNDTDSMEGKIFQYEHLNKTYTIIPDKVIVYQGVDLAISQKETADYFCIVTIAKDEFGRIFLIDIYKERLSFLQQTQKIIEKNRQFKPRRVFIESNAYQAAQAQIVAMHDVPVRAIYTQKDKVTRAWQLSSKFENGMVFLPEWGTQEFIDQLIAFPDVDHDDMFDAFEIAVTGSTRFNRKPRKEFGLI